MNLKFFKKPLAIVALAVLTAFIGLSTLVERTGAYTVYLENNVRKTPIYSVDRDDNKISISFDCAYGADYTLSLLDTLDKYNVKCTFFCVEFWVKKYPEMVREIVKRGHEIGTHSKTHPNMSKLSKSEMIKELSSSVYAIENITNVKVELFRPPYGDYNTTLIDVCEELKLYPIQWDVDSIDWKDLSASEIVSRVVKKTKSGSIILCHNNGLHTHEALPTLLANLQEKGYEFVKISELIYKENYKINSFGVQVKND